MLNTYPAELQQFVRQELANGAYRSEDELLVDALTVFRELKQRHEELRVQVQRSIEQANRGEVQPWDVESLLAEAHRRHAEQLQ